MWLRTVALAAAAAFMGVTHTVSARNASHSDNDQNKVVVTKSSASGHPSCPNNTHPWERPMMVKIRQDGTIDSFEVVSGHRVLQHRRWI